MADKGNPNNKTESSPFRMVEGLCKRHKIIPNVVHFYTLIQSFFKLTVYFLEIATKG